MLDTPNNFLSRNTLLLKNNHPHIWAALQNYGGTVTRQIFYTNKDDLPNIRVANSKGKIISLHLESDPEAEVSQFLNLIPENSTGVVILYGMGLGYTPKAILDKRPQIRHLIIFEESYSVFDQAILHLDHSKLLSDNRVILSIGEIDNVASVLAPAMRALKLENIHTLNHLPSMDCNPVFYEKVSQQVFNITNENNMEGNTLRGYGEMFLSNRLQHLKNIRHHYLLESLQNCFSGKPAIIVAGGPSLDKNIHVLHKAKGKAVIFAADTVLPALLSHGIVPNFLSSIDYKNHIYEKLAHTAPQVTQDSINLICSSWVNPRVPQTFPTQNIFWTFTFKKIEQWLASSLGGNFVVPGSATVAHLNFISARLLGCSPIIFIGQDLAYSKNNSHSSQTFLTSSDIAAKELEVNNIVVRGVVEPEVATTRTYHNLKTTFESLINNSSNHCINATEGGVHIEGTEIFTLEDSIAKYCTSNFPVQETVQSKKTSVSISTSNLQKELTEALRQAKEILEKIDLAKAPTKSVLNVVEKYKKSHTQRYNSFQNLPSSTQKKLRSIERAQDEIDNYKPIWKLLEEVTICGLKKNERLKMSISKLAGDPQLHLKWLGKNLERLVYLNEFREGVISDFIKNITEVLDYIKKETKIISLLEKKATDPKKLRKIITFYIKEEQWGRARLFLQQLHIDNNDAELNLYAGMIAAHRTEYDEADIFFKQAKKADSGYEQKIKKFQTPLAEQYLQYAILFHNRDLNTTRKLLLKGLRYCPKHLNTQKALTELAQNILGKAENNFDDEKTAMSLQGWVNDLHEHKYLAAKLPENLQSKIFFNHGKILLGKSRYGKAVDSLENSLSILPNNPDVHILLTEAFFCMEKFDQGLEHLKNAVKLNSACAVYWEQIGNSLARSGQPQDALYAYEQYFTASPENIGILKKIGDCYMALGQLEAAKEAYTQLKNQLDA